MNVLTSNARDVAVLALRDRKGNVSAHLGKLLSRAYLLPPDAALARELALGVVRRRATLEAVLRAFLARPERRLPGSLNEILHVALYQVLFLERVPAFAAVSEAVEQTGRFRHRRQSGLVNGVLRTVTRSVSEIQTGPVPVSAEAIPVGPGAYRLAGRAVFPDPAGDPAGYLAAAYSLPELLATRWIEHRGSLGEAVRLAAHANARAPLILRVNAAVSDVAAVTAELSAGGVGARPHANGHSVVLDGYCNVTKLEPFARGAVQPQDPSATAVVLAADPQPGSKVLDFCAAPGTKTTHLAERMGNRGSITAVDVSAAKLAQIEANCRRMGAGIVTPTLAEDVGRLEVESFDLVLADVPCTNTGVLARRPEARWRFTEESLRSRVKDQKLLCRAAAAFVRPGGRLVYSTCSIEPEEGTEVARWLQRTVARMRLTDEQLTLPEGADDPTHWRDGGYLAIFVAG